ncbi:MAG: inorganic phosphate transporter [Archaeoglobaceae archaeon]
MIDILIILAVLSAFYVAWNIGANDAANSMATSYGSRALNLRQIIIIAAILEFFGATFFGKNVVKTIAKGIVPIEILDPNLVVYGSIAALLSAGLWITIATYLHLPISTTHSIVGAMLGFGIAAVSQGHLTVDAIKWDELLKIMLSWLISPIAGAILAFFTFSLIRFFLFRKFHYEKVERVFRYLQIFSACYVAFAHGSNDVANAVAPMSAIFGLRAEGYYEIPREVLAFGGFGIALGIATWGYRVIKMVGERITELTFTRGFSAEFATATTVLTASAIGIPISTTHTLVGSVIGVGLAGGLAGVNLDVIQRIIFSWILTLPIAMLLSIGIYTILVVFV